jgi:alkylation response protein AidB-like acyl-CoA dehydrogenase
VDLSLTEPQEMLRASARTFIEREAPPHTIIALQRTESSLVPDLWQKACAAGWLGILIPSEHGGSDGSVTDAAVLYEELGRGPVPGPFFSSGVLGALTILEGATDAQKRALLPRVARGDVILAVAVLEPNASWGPQGVTLTPQRNGARYTLHGTKLFVSDATAATDLIVAVRTGESADAVSLLHVGARAKGVTIKRLPGFLSWQCEVTFDGADAHLVGDREGQGWHALDRAFVKALPVLCAFMVGGCQAVFDMSVKHSQVRVQFGVPIGKFQRVQDHIIRLVNQLDAARWTTNEALWKVDTGRADAVAAVHMAKAVASESYLEACNAAHEVHAGQGSLIEYGLVAHTQMSRTLFAYLGDPRWHKRRMADALEW